MSSSGGDILYEGRSSGSNCLPLRGMSLWNSLIFFLKGILVMLSVEDATRPWPRLDEQNAS